MATRKKSFRERGIVSRLLFSRVAITALCLLIQIAILVSVLVWLGTYSTPILGSLSLLTVIVIVYILNSESNPAYKLAWIIPVTLLPALGSLMYLYVKLDLGSRAAKGLLGLVLQETAAFGKTEPEVAEALQAEDSSVGQLAHYIDKTGGYAAYRNCAVSYFPVGEDAFPVMLEELRKAERFIFLEYFIIEEGQFWDSVLDVLEQKAKQGVEVRVMYDDLGCVALLPRNYPEILAQKGIRACAYSRLQAFLSTHYNNRDHRKILVIDGKVAFSGGVNLADEYINQKQVYGHWKDTSFRVTGEAVRGYTLMFLQLWNVVHFQKRDDYAQYFPQIKPPATPWTEGYIIPYGDGPHQKENVAEHVYMDMLHHAKHRVSIMTPYLILDNELLQAILHAVKRGVTVQLLLPHIPDKWFAIVIARSYYPLLIRAGVQVYEYTPGFVHAKMFLADDDLAVVGTVNLDFRSLYLHYECGTLFYRHPVIQDIAEDVKHTLAVSQRITLEAFYRMRLLDRLAGRVLRIFGPLL